MAGGSGGSYSSGHVSYLSGMYCIQLLRNFDAIVVGYLHVAFFRQQVQKPRLCGVGYAISVLPYISVRIY